MNFARWRTSPLPPRPEPRRASIRWLLALKLCFALTMHHPRGVQHPSPLAGAPRIHPFLESSSSLQPYLSGQVPLTGHPGARPAEEQQHPAVTSRPANTHSSFTPQDRSSLIYQRARITPGFTAVNISSPSALPAVVRHRDCAPYPQESSVSFHVLV